MEMMISVIERAEENAVRSGDYRRKVQILTEVVMKSLCNLMPLDKRELKGGNKRTEAVGQNVPGVFEQKANRSHGWLERLEF